MKENLDAYFMNYPQLMKILRSISTDLCMIEFIAHMKVDENGDSCLSGAEDPNMVLEGI